MRTLWLILLTAASYFVAGRLGLQLAIPPGYAAAVWPASGLALAAVILWGYRVWPGILLGSFCVNVSTSLGASGTETLLGPLGLTAIIASGAALQAVVGGWLVRQIVGYRNVLTQGFGVVWILLLGGPLSCILNASISVTSLWAAGSIPASNYLFNWWTWWVGDSIGVLVFTPLVLVWALRPWSRWRRQQIIVTIPLICSFIAVVGLFIFVSQREEARIRAEFEKWVYSFSHELEKDLGIYRNTLSALTGLFIGSEEVTREEFTHFTELLLANNQAVQALAWNPRVTAVDRERFELTQRQSVDPDYRIYVMEGGKRAIAAPDKDVYFPVLYTEPLAANMRSLGYDISSEPVRRQAIESALKAGKGPVATGPIRLVQRQDDQYGLLLIEPVYRDQRPERELQGFVVVVLQVAAIMQAAADRVASTGLHAEIYDSTDARAPIPIYSNVSQHGSHTPAGHLQLVHTLDFAGRTWRIDYHVVADYLVASRSWQAWSLMAVGLLLTALLGIFLLLSVGYAARIATVVDERTAQLNDSNAALQLEIAERTFLQQQADLRSRQLSEKNQELERFAYVVSHDLQAPLRGVTGFAELLSQRFSKELGDEGREFIEFISAGTRQMHRMIADILELSRIGTREIKLGPVDTGSVIGQVCNMLKLDIEASSAKIRHEALPVVQADEGQLLLLFQNLIGNALKFCPAGGQPVIDVSAAQETEGWHFRVKDNGLGIAKDMQPRLFNLFVRLHTSEEYAGTGLGLAICKRIVERHDGRIWLESEAGAGTTVHFILPVRP